MPFADVPQFMARLRKRDAVAALALEFTILTAARSGETLGARWAEIDFEKRLDGAGRAHESLAARTALRCRAGRWRFSKSSMRGGPANTFFRDSGRASR